MSTLAKALPSIGWQCHLRMPPIRSIRLFSSSHSSLESSKEANRQIERQIFDSEATAASGRASPLAQISGMMDGDDTQANQSAKPSNSVTRFAASLQAELIDNAYLGRPPMHHLHIYSHKHNTLLTLTRPNGNPLLSMSCGHLGFRKGGRAGYDPAYQLASHVFGKIQEKGHLMEIERLELVFRGFGTGREAVIKVLLGNEGRNIRPKVARVTDSTRIKFGGTRSRKVRRLG